MFSVLRCGCSSHLVVRYFGNSDNKTCRRVVQQQTNGGFTLLLYSSRQHETTPSRGIMKVQFLACGGVKNEGVSRAEKYHFNVIFDNNSPCTDFFFTAQFFFIATQKTQEQGIGEAHTERKEAKNATRATHQGEALPHSLTTTHTNKQTTSSNKTHSNKFLFIMSNWQPNEQGLAQILQLLVNSRTYDNQIQAQITEVRTHRHTHTAQDIFPFFSLISIP